MNKKGILGCILAMVAVSAQADPYFMDGYALQERLLKQEPTALAYIFGVYDAVQITQYHAAGADRIVCPPPAVSGSELVDAVNGYLRAEPAISVYPAALVVLRALIWAFPCGKT